MVAPNGNWVAAVDTTRRVVLYQAKPGPPHPTTIVLESGEALIRVTQDGQGIYVNRWMEPDGAAALPARVYRVDFATGTRRFAMNLAPTDPAGVSTVALPYLTPDHRGYVFHYIRILSDLFLVEGLR